MKSHPDNKKIMKSFKILISVFVVFLSACGTSQMTQSSSSGDDVYYSSSSVQSQPVQDNNTQTTPAAAPVEQPAPAQQYSTDADNDQIVTSSGDNTQDLNRSAQDYPQDSSEQSYTNT